MFLHLLIISEDCSHENQFQDEAVITLINI